MKHVRKKPSIKSRLHFEAIEPRILFDAAAGSAPTADVSVPTDEFVSEAYEVLPIDGTDDGPFKKISIQPIAPARLDPANAPIAEVSVNVVEEEFINEDVQFNLSFDNTGGSEGYAPYVDFVAVPELQITGVETFGAPAENPAGPAVLAIGQIASDGQLVDLATGTTPIDHPMFANPTDGGTYGLAGSGTSPVLYDVASNPDLVGMYVYTVQLPFGSFTAGNPPANVSVTASLDKVNGIIPHEEVVAYAQGGFAYGCDALHNPGADEPIASGLSSDGVTPLVINLNKTAGTPEVDGFYTGENASGPNHPITYTLTVDLAENEEVDDLVIQDLLPDDLAYTNNLTVTFGAGTGGTKGYTVNSEPELNTDGMTAVDPTDNELQITVDNIIGSGGGDIVVTYTTFVPYEEADGTLIVDPVSGEEADLDPAEYNDASVVADYDYDGAGPAPEIQIGDNEGPMNPATPYESFSDDTDYRIEEHSIATQKGVGIASDGDRAVIDTLNSGDVLEYNIDFQISDYFAFTDVVFDDVMSDGQEFLPALDSPSSWVNAADFDTDPVQTRPEFTFTMHGNSTTVVFDESNFSAIENADGTTSIHFDVYQQLVDAGYINDGDPLLGGFIEEAGTAPADLGPTNFNGGATTGTITYRALVRDAYQFGSQAEISQGDTLDNDVIVTGMNRNIETFAAIQNVTDDSASSIGIPVGSVIKETINLYSHGQMISLEDDNDPTTRPAIAVTPGDLVTYRIQYQLPISEFENLTFTDFVPLPIFDIDGAGTLGLDLTQIYDYDAVDSFQTPGRISFGPGDTFFGPDGPGGSSGIEFDNPGYNSTAGMTPTISIVEDGSSNTFEVGIGSYDVGDGNDPVATMVELLVTLEVQDGEFADGLFFTNQVITSEASTTGGTTNTDEISQSILSRPELNILKGVTAVTHNDGVFDASQGPATVNFEAPGSVSAWTGGPITSDALDTTPIDANLSNIDAGDVVTFFIVVENTGTSTWGAFDVSVTDTIPAGMAIQAGDPNLRVTLGDGTVLNAGTDYTGDLFNTPLELIDPDVDEGSLTGYSETSGTNLVVIAYDLVVEDSAQALEIFTNVAEVETYSSFEGGADYAAPGELTDDATVQVAAPAVDKVIIKTSHVDTDNLDANAEVTIGEVVTYQVTIEIPEGEMTNARILDTLPAGMAFVGLDSVTFDSNLTTDLGAGDFTDVEAFYNVGASTLELGINGIGAGLGTMTNGDRDNLEPETVVFIYRAVVLNDADANRSDIKINDAEIRWTPPQGEQVVEDSESVLVVEPDVSVAKSVVGGTTTVEGAQEITYQIVVTNNDTNEFVSEAYEVVLADVLPVEVSYVAASVTHTAGVAPNGGTLIFDNTNGPEGTIRAVWDRLGVGESSTIEVTVRIDDALATDTVIENIADVEFTSLPDNPGDASYTGYDPATAGPNIDPSDAIYDIAVERTGDPTDPGGAANDYTDTDPAAVTVANPVGIDKVIIDTAEAHTAFDASALGQVQGAIGEVVRYEVGIQIPQATSSQIQLVDVLDPNLFWIDAAANNLEIRLEGFAADNSTLTADADIVAANGGSVAFDPARVSFDGPNNTVTFNFGDIVNTETDPEPEFIYISYNAIVRNDTDVNRGDTLTNTVQLREGGEDIGTPLTQSLVVVEPELDIVKSDNGVTTADAGDVITYTLMVTAADDGSGNHTTAFEVTVGDTLPAELDLVSGSLNVQDLPGGSTVLLQTEDLAGDLINVIVDQVGPGESFIVEFQARVRDTGTDVIHSDEIVTNQATLGYSSLPIDGTDDGTGDNMTGNESGVPDAEDGERIYSDTSSDDFSSPAPTFTKVLGNPADTTFTIGEPVEYVLTIQVPEGRVGDPSAYVLDSVDPGFRFVPGTLQVTLGTGITVGTAGTLDEANATFFTHTDPGDTAQSEGLQFDLGFIDFNNGGAGDGVDTSGTVEIRYLLQVENILANQEGDTLNNTADFLYTDDDGTTTNTVDDTTGDTDTIITIVEPQVNATKAIASIPAAPDAGDTVSYQVTLTHPGGPANPLFDTPAFDVTVRDVMPAGLEIQTGTFTATLNGLIPVTGLFSVTANGFTDNPASSIDLQPGDEIVITYDAVIDTGVRDGESFVNDVDIEWTSLDDDDPTDGIDVADTNERTGDGDFDNVVDPTIPNDYENEVDVSFNADLTFAFTKTIVSTSAAHTGVATGDPLLTDLTIGETVTYALTATVGRGTVDGIRITDQLDLAAGYLDITNVSFTTGAALSAPTFATATPTISDTNFDSYNDFVEYDFGTVINDPGLLTGAADDEQIIVYITATVVNDIENEGGDIITNTGNFFYFDDPDGDGTQTEQLLDDTKDVELVEPDVDVTKTITTVPANPDAGDTVSYQVLVANTSDTDAFDVTFQDILPVQMDLDPTSFTATLTSSGGDVSGFFSLTADDIRHVGTGFNLAAGDSITITYDTTILTTVTDGAFLTNEADIEWTSLDDGDPASGDLAEARGGDGDFDNPSDPTNPNDYENEDVQTVTANLSPVYDFTKTILTTSAGHTDVAAGTDPAMTDLVVGEVVTYVLTATMGEGTTNGVQITDSLGLANGLLDIRNVRVSGGSNLTTDVAPDFNSVGFNIIDSNTDTFGDSVFVDLGTVVNDASGTNPGDDQIRIEIDAVVVNELENQNGDIITNTGNLRFLEDLDNDGVADDETNLNDTVDVEIVEPQVNVTKAIASIPAEPAAGDTVSYQITLTHPGGPANPLFDAAAYDVTVRDVMPAGVEIQTGTFTATLNGLTPVTGLFSVTANGFTDNPASSIDLQPGDEIVITYDAYITPAVRDGEALVNDVDIEWTSLDDDDPTDGIDVADTDERTGDGDFDNVVDPTNPNDYENGDDVSFEAEFTNTFAFTKSIVSTSAAHTGIAAGTDPLLTDLTIGETVTYALTATVGRGTVDGVRITDQLDLAAGYLDITNVSFTTGAALSAPTFATATPTISDTNFDSYNDFVEYDFGTVVNDPSLLTGAADDEQIIVYITATVVNDIENEGGDIITNTGSFFYFGDPDGDGTQTEQTLNDTEDVELVEPNVDVTKSITNVPANPDAGDTVSYQVLVANTSDTDAFDVTFQDILPVQMDLDPTSFTATLTSSGNDVSGFFSLAAEDIRHVGTGFNLAAGDSVTITYDTTILSTVTDGAFLVNEVDIEWATLDDDDPTSGDLAEVRGGDGDPDSTVDPTNPNDYENEDVQTVTANLSPVYDFTKTILTTSAGHTDVAAGTDPAMTDLVVGEVVTYVLTATMGEGTTNGVQITDSLGLANGLLDIRNVRVSGGSNLTTDVAPDFNSVGFNIIDSNTDTFGDSVFVDFGTVVNDASGTNPGDNQIRIEIDAVVVNELENQNGDIITNTGNLRFLEDLDNDGVADDETNLNDTVDVEIVEPQVNVTKAIASIPAEPAAGDTVSYQITLTHPGGPANPLFDAAAFDVTVRDVMPAGVEIQTATFTATLNGLAPVTGLFSVTANGFTDDPASSIDLQPGDEIVITYDAYITPAVRDGEALVNDVDIEWTSLDDDDPTDGIDVADTDERTGDGDFDNVVDPTNPDDYENGDDVSFEAEFTNTFAFTKSIVSTSASHTGIAAGTDPLLTDLTIGETVTYALTATIGSGTVDGVRLTDQLDLAAGYLDITNVSFTTGAALSAPTFATATPTISDTNFDSYNDFVEYDFGTVVNDPALLTGAADDEQIIVYITATVVNDIENEGGDIITNTGNFFYFDDPDGDGIQTEQTLNDTEDVELVEPNVDVTKSITNVPANPDAGDTVSYQVLVTNTSDTDAFDVTFQDILPVQMNLDPTSFTATLTSSGNDVSGFFSLAAEDIRHVGTGFNLAAGDSVTITYDTTILSTVTDGAFLVNEVDIEWATLDDDDPTSGDLAEVRGGDGDPDSTVDPTNPNDYENEDVQTVTANLSPVYDFTKTILTTSAGHTDVAAGTDPAMTDLVVGEVVTYVLTATMGEGTTNGVQITDSLGLANGLLDIRNVRVSGGSNLTTDVAPDFNSVGFNIIDSNTDTFGDSVFVDFGTVVNDASGTNPGDNQIRIEIDAVVVNELENQNGDIITNTGNLRFLEDLDNDGVADDETNLNDTVDVEIVEPQVNVTKAIASIPGAPAAGDTVSYQITLTHPGGPANPLFDAAAFDVTVRDVMPAGVEIQTGTFTATLNGLTPVTGLFSVTANGFTDDPASSIDLQPGDEIVITYDAYITPAVRDGEALVNDVDIEWTSLDDNDPTDGIDVADTDERTGDGDFDNVVDPTNPDDYENGDDVSFEAEFTNTFAFTKTIVSTSAAHTNVAAGTDPLLTDLTIGETVTYALTATVGRGTVDGVRITDQLDLAAGYLDITNVSFTTGAALSAPTFATATPTISDTNFDSYNDFVEYDFGTVVNDPGLLTGAADDEQIIVYITATVVNDIENQGGDIITNTGNFFYFDDPDGDGTQTEQTLNDTEDVELVEPNVDVTKSITNVPANPDAGDTVSYQVLVANTSDTDAFDVTFQDILPVQMDLDPTSFTATLTSSGGDVSGFFSLTADDIRHAGTGFNLAAGDSITITYDTTILSTVTDGAFLTNEVDIEWATLDDDDPTSGDLTEVRGGDGDPDNPSDPTNPNDYENEDAQTVTANLTPVYDFTKSILTTSAGHTDVAAGTDPAMTDLVIGEVVTYVLTATMGEGTTNGVQITDSLGLANGLLDIRNVRVSGGSNLTTDVAPNFNFVGFNIIDSNTDTFGDSVFVDFGTVVNDASGTNPGDNQIRIEIDAVVVNELENQGGDIITNTGNLRFLEDLDNDGVADDETNLNDTVDVEIVEPQVTVAKSIPSGTTLANAGDVINYQIIITNTSDIDAMDVTFLDILPSQMDLDPGSFTATRTSDGNDVSDLFNATANDITQVGTGFNLATGDTITITYNANVLATVTDGAAMTNFADVEWTSLDDDVNDGSDVDERGGDSDPNNPADPTNPNDYESEDDVTLTGELSPQYVFDKSIFSTSGDHTGTAFGTDPALTDLVVGETVTYALTATIGQGTTPSVLIEDVLNLTNGILDIRDVTITSGAGITLGDGSTLPNTIIPTVSDSNTDGYNDSVSINFGTVINDPTRFTGAADDEQITVYIEAVVVNILDNEEGDIINNLGRLTVTEDTDGDGVADNPVVREDNVNVEIIEPSVLVEKAVTNVPANPDAQDIVSYQVVVRNTTDIDAFDVSFIDDLPNKLIYDSNFTATRDSDSADVSAFFQIAADNSGITHTGTGFDLGANDFITVTYDARITEAILDGEQLTNLVDVEWTSTPGDNPDERGGDEDPNNPADPTNPDDYESEDETTIEANLTGYEFDKSIFATSMTHTDATGGTDAIVEDLVVGETVTYALVATFAEGTTTGVVIADDIQIANGILDVRNVSFVPGSNLIVPAVAPVIDDVDGDGFNENVILNFGTVVNNGLYSVDPLADQLVIYIEAVVVNIIENQEGDVIVNDATFTFLEDSNADNIIDGTDTPTVIEDAAVVEIIEPNLSIAKAVSNETPKLNEVVTYTLTLTNNAGVSTTDAFDVVIDDSMDSRLTLDPGSITLTILGTPANPSSITFNHSTANNIVLGIDLLEEGESVEISYEVRISDDPADFDAVLPNAVDLTYTSTPGDNPDERGGPVDPSDPSDPNDPNDYGDTDDESVEVHQPDLVIVKDDAGAVIRPGQRVDYTMTVTNQGRATALGVTITDDISHYLAEGFQFVSGTNATISGGVVTFVLPDMPVDDVQTVTLTLRAPAVIPAGLEELENIATANHIDIEPSPGDNTDDEPTPIVAFPDLIVTKDDGLSHATVGDQITYAITFDNVGDQVASGVVINDTLPPGVRFISATDGGKLAGGSVAWTIDQLRPGEGDTFYVTVEVLTDGLKLNNVSIEDDGSGGPDPTPDNNTAQDRTTAKAGLQFDLNQNFLSGPGNTSSITDGFRKKLELQFPGYEFEPQTPVMYATFMNSGLAQAGSTITLEVYDQMGRLIADTSVVADAGGNWLATFPMADVDKLPSRVVIKQTWASSNPVDQRGYNFRTYFGPAFTTGTYYTEELSIYNATEKMDATEVIDLYESSKMMLAMDWNGTTYEFAARGALQSSSGN